MKKFDSGHLAGQRLVLVLTTLLVFVGCGGRQAGISALNVGDNAEGLAGQVVPVSANLRTIAPIEYLEVDIRPITDGITWTFNRRFMDGVSGGKNLSFSTMVDIPVDAEPGDYKVTLSVATDDQTVFSESIDLRVSIDSTVPVVSNLDVGINAAGNDLHLETELAVAGKIKEVLVEVVGEDWRNEFSFAGNKLVGQVTYRFHEHVNVGQAPAGTYFVTLTVKDQQGRQAHKQATFTKK